jgi:hypothetical protein
MGYSASTLQQVSVFNLTPNGSEGGIWMSGDGMAVDPSGNIYLLTGNGTFDTQLDARGFPINGNFGNSFLKLSAASGALAVVDYFTMSNVVQESAIDWDLGSGGVLVLPDLVDSLGTTRHLAVGAGKDSNIYVADRDSMGKFDSANAGLYQEIDGALPGGLWATPALFRNTLYYGPTDHDLMAFPISNARLAIGPASQSATAFSYPGATPSVSANGDQDGIVWAVENGVNAGVLHAYDPADLAHEYYNSAQTPNGRDAFTYNKFATPTIANGRVYVGTPVGVAVFGLLP